jgi:CBS domain containing-hemolysin-like protein
MNIDSPKDRPDPPADTAEQRSSVALRWLAALRTRLGLQGAPTLRATLEDALKEGDPMSAAFTAEEREMLLRLLHFGAARVDDIMVPRADIIAVEESEPLQELVLKFEEGGVSRIPVYHETLDDPRGMIHIKDLFRWLTAEAMGRPSGELRSRDERRDERAKSPREDKEAGKFGPDLKRLDLSRPISVAKIRLPVLYVPPSMSAMNLLIRMQTTRIHMALVVDEYGGTDGLVTIEDLVEQVVGDIEDEHDEAEAAHITTEPKLGLVASARTTIEELEAHLGIKLLSANEEEDIDTLGGLVFAIVGRVPARGEIVRHVSGVEFEVLDADPRRVKKLRIYRPKPADPQPGPADGAKS